ncbi:hypothetical protein JCM24511_02319 [Saitozyma sp. JCM 24511]|nr:hypothetical protein JCM24511_02319 [Saitozyma sp. JCM 24511]
MYPATANGSSISSTTSSYLFLVGANSTTAPGSVPVNTIANTGGDSYYLETGVWSYNPITTELTAIWNNGQDSVPLTFAFSSSMGPLLTGDYAALTLPSTATSVSLDDDRFIHADGTANSQNAQTAKIVQETD